MPDTTGSILRAILREFNNSVWDNKLAAPNLPTPAFMLLATAYKMEPYHMWAACRLSHSTIEFVSGYGIDKHNPTTTVLHYKFACDMSIDQIYTRLKFKENMKHIIYPPTEVEEI